ncbi:MAG: DUF2807 domain-containing protein [Pseudomonadota bacterium]|nr:DUF2807 domain-containing protein [Pseudomonadota bacterium]
MNYAAIAMLAGLTACSMSWNDDKGAGVAGTGSGTARSYAVTDFTGVELRGSDDVDVRVGAGFSVRAEGPEKELEQLRIARDGDTLKVGRKSGMRWGEHGKVKVYVTLPRLAAADVAGSGDMAIDRVEGANFAGTVAGSGDLGVAAMVVDAAKLSIAGSGDLSAAGTAKALTVDIAGSGNLAARGLTAQQAKVSIAGSGSATAVVNGPATVSIVGSGDVDLGTGATCSVSKVGSGSVRCR